jgi:protein phosphatase
MKFSIYQDTEIGGRPVNQDRMGYAYTRDCLLMLVADGMGGHARGEVAAQLAAQAIADSFHRQARPTLIDPEGFLVQALLHAHEEILAYQIAERLAEPPRTTMVACIVQGDTAWWAHAGDSRLYLIRDGAAVQRTRDHSRVETLVALGLLLPGEASVHPDRNRLHNCLGSPQEPTVELSPPARLMPGDLLLLCSDGVWSALDEERMVQTLGGGGLDRAVPSLVRASIASAGRHADNATALAMRWEGGAGSDAPVAVAGPADAQAPAVAPSDAQAPAVAPSDAQAPAVALADGPGDGAAHADGCAQGGANGSATDAVADAASPAASVAPGSIVEPTRPT